MPIPARDAEVIKICQSRFPRYMVPTRIYHFQQIPLNVNGKIDRGKDYRDAGELERIRGNCRGQKSDCRGETPTARPLSALRSRITRHGRYRHSLPILKPRKWRIPLQPISRLQIERIINIHQPRIQTGAQLRCRSLQLVSRLYQQIADAPLNFPRLFRSKYPPPAPHRARARLVASRWNEEFGCCTDPSPIR